MAFEVSLEPNEQLIFQDGFKADKYTEPFAFAVTDRAIFITRVKHFRKDPWYFEKVPLSKVNKVILRRERSLPIWILSGLCFVFGWIFLIKMMLPALRGDAGYVSGVPLAMIVCGIVIPFIARGRNALIVELEKGKYKWKPRLVVDKESRNQVRQFQENILNACRSAGIKVERVNTK
jgi:hypothetical protein